MAWTSWPCTKRRTRLSEQVRETGKPFAIEAMTYRIAPHGAADFLEKYRSKEEVKKLASAIRSVCSKQNPRSRHRH